MKFHRVTIIHINLVSNSFKVLSEHGCVRNISQMPVVLIPIHFDRDPANRVPSSARSVVLRPFLTSDFMTGVPILPGSDRLSAGVSIQF